MRELNQPQAYNYNTLIEDLKAVQEAMPHTTLVAAGDGDGYKDGFAVLSLSAPYYISDKLAAAIADPGLLRDAFLRCDYSQIYAADQEVRLYFIVKDVWQIGEELPAPMTIDINRRIQDRVLARKVAKDGPGLHIVK